MTYLKLVGLLYRFWRYWKKTSPEGALPPLRGSEPMEQLETKHLENPIVLSKKLSLGDTPLIINEAKKQGLLRNELAYVLATAYHETAHTMKPVREYGGETYLKKKKYYPYVGMGYVQLTWDYNYKKASDKLGVDFLKDPRLLLKSEYATPILVIGMKEGWFTGKKLSDYITLQKSDFVSARRIINGTDKASTIAGYAKEYDALLKNVYT